MPKNDNPHAVRLYQSVLNHVGEDAANRIADKAPLSKSADFQKKFGWAETVCTELEREFDANTVKKIRMDCACGPETGKLDKLRKAYQSAADLSDFSEKANQLHLGFTIRYANGELFLIYPQCYCSCVKRVEKPVSKSWCYCSLGYAKKAFEYILDRSVEVELIESVKTGGKECRIKIFL